MFFIFKLENFLRSYLNFSTSYGRSTEFYTAWRKNSLERQILGGERGTFDTPPLMSKLVKANKKSPRVKMGEVKNFVTT